MLNTSNAFSVTIELIMYFLIFYFTNVIAVKFTTCYQVVYAGCGMIVGKEEKGTVLNKPSLLSRFYQCIWKKTV